MSKPRAGVISKDETRRIEDETRRMEMKLDMLRKTLDTQDTEKKGQGASRWKAADAKKPLTRGYANQVLQSKGSETKRAPARQPSGSTPAEQPAEVTSRSPLATVLSGQPSAEEPQTRTGAACQAATNLQAAISQQSSEASEVEAFLTGIGLDRYNSLFLEHGFDCLEVVMEMQESHMQDIGMSPGHIIKLRKRLADMNPSATAPAAKVPAGGSSLAGSRRNVTWGATEAAHVSAAKADGVACGGGTLLDGAYDEAEAAASFQEAVMAWRKQGQGNIEEIGAKKAQTPTGPGSFWSSIGGSDMDLIRASTPTQPPAEAAAAVTESEIQHDPAPSEEKLCCYQCYKQFYAKYAVERASPFPEADAEKKRLCSEACADAWVKAVEAKAEALRKRREQLEMMEERARAMTEAAQGDSLPQQLPVAA